MGLNGRRDVAALRQLGVDNGGRARMNTDGEWANLADIHAVATGLGIRIVVVSLSLDYQINQVNPRGSSGPIHYIAHIFNGHYVPMYKG